MMRTEQGDPHKKSTQLFCLAVRMDGQASFMPMEPFFPGAEISITAVGKMVTILQGAQMGVWSYEGQLLSDSKGLCRPYPAVITGRSSAPRVAQSYVSTSAITLRRMVLSIHVLTFCHQPVVGKIAVSPRCAYLHNATYFGNSIFIYQSLYFALPRSQP